jgi:hypothetical protein
MQFANLKKNLLKLAAIMPMVDTSKRFHGTPGSLQE